MHSNARAVAPAARKGVSKARMEVDPAVTIASLRIAIVRAAQSRIGQPEYLASEIFIPVENPTQEAEARRFVDEVSRQLRGGMPFQVAASGRATPTDANTIQLSRGGVAQATAAADMRAWCSQSGAAAAAEESTAEGIAAEAATASAPVAAASR